MLVSRDVTSVAACYTATVDEVLADMQTVALQRTRRPLPERVVAIVRTSGTCRSVDLRFLLTPRERAALNEYTCAYVARWRQNPEADVNACFFLGDNPGNRTTWSAVSGAIPTLRRNAGFLWSPYLGRWLCLKELQAAMGFPVTSEIASALGVSYDRLGNYAQGTEGRRLLGNAMHCAAAGVALMVALSCVKLKSTEPNASC